MSLIKKNKDKELLTNQFIDLETLNWIKKNKPKFTQNSGDVKIINCKRMIYYFNKFFPKHNWFAKKGIINSIHGVRHLMRVLVYTVIISKYINLNQRTLNKLCLVSAIHDIRRVNDSADTGHGQRTAKWFMENSNCILDFFKFKITKSDVNEIYHIIFFHDLDYESILNDKNYLKYKNNIDIFKTLDALDRYRLPKLKWWLDDRRLFFIPPSFLKNFSYELILASEELFLSNKNNKKCLVQSLNQVYHKI